MAELLFTNATLSGATYTYQSDSGTQPIDNDTIVKTGRWIKVQIPYYASGAQLAYSLYGKNASHCVESGIVSSGYSGSGESGYWVYTSGCLASGCEFDSAKGCNIYINNGSYGRRDYTSTFPTYAGECDFSGDYIPITEYY